MAFLSMQPVTLMGGLRECNPDRPQLVLAPENKTEVQIRGRSSVLPDHAAGENQQPTSGPGDGRLQKVACLLHPRQNFYSFICIFSAYLSSPRLFLNFWCVFDLCGGFFFLF